MPEKFEKINFEQEESREGKGEIKIDPPLSDDQIGPGSIDFSLSNTFWKMRDVGKKPKDLKATDFTDIFEEIKAESVILQPGELVLAKTLERITLAPNICGWIQGRSRYARMGLSVHVASSFIQPGSSNHQVLEIVNLSHVPLTIHAGMRICQVIFERTESPTSRPYSKHGKFADQ